jgi:predicted component of type VI protein secretion system
MQNTQYTETDQGPLGQIEYRSLAVALRVSHTAKIDPFTPTCSIISLVPYIVIKSNGQEVARRELDRGVVVGRAPDCDVSVRDILLSRRHCRLQPSDDGWMVQDLQSKNGTVIDGERLRVPRLLSDNDVIRLGRSKIIFHAGLPEEDFADRRLTPARPADPGDSLAGTLSGFSLLLPGEGEIPEDMPCPQPRPKDPPAYDHEELQQLLTAIASSSWDSVYAEARQPLRGGQGIESDEDSQSRRRVRPSSPTDLSLQVNPASLPSAVAVEACRPRRKSGFRPSLHVIVVTIWLGFLALLTTNHNPIAGGSMPRQAPGRFPAANLHSNEPSADVPVNGDLLEAADEEFQEPSGPAAPPPTRFNPAAARAAAAAAGVHFLMIW